MRACVCVCLTCAMCAGTNRRRITTEKCKLAIEDTHTDLKGKVMWDALKKSGYVCLCVRVCIWAVRDASELRVYASELRVHIWAVRMYNAHVLTDVQYLYQFADAKIWSREVWSVNPVTGKTQCQHIMTWNQNRFYYVQTLTEMLTLFRLVLCTSWYTYMMYVSLLFPSPPHFLVIPLHTYLQCTCRHVIKRICMTVGRELVVRYEQPNMENAQDITRQEGGRVQGSLLIDLHRCA